jgi:hypothetical protein
MANETVKRIGAGGWWRVIDEQPDPTVEKQITLYSCVAAVGVMLLRANGISVTQQSAIDIIGESSTIEELGRFLNSREPIGEQNSWHGIIVDDNDLLTIAAHQSFAAVFREGRPLGHMVLVVGLEGDMLKINDPWDGTTYWMKLEEFRRVWNGDVVLQWKLSR